jgi:DNA invertase Pin-like site-specific DNA recombinase
MEVVEYVQVSTSEQIENGVSLAAQKHRIRE